MATDPARPPVALALSALGIPHRVFRHPGPVASLEQAARERGQSPDQVVRSLLFRLGGEAKGAASASSYLMVLVAGPQQVAWPVLRRYLGQSRLTLATPDEVRSVTGYEIGAVAPFGLPQPLRVLVDESVLAPSEVSIGSGERGVTVILASADLRRALGDLETGRFAAE